MREDVPKEGQYGVILAEKQPGWAPIRSFNSASLMRQGKMWSKRLVMGRTPRVYAYDSSEKYIINQHDTFNPNNSDNKYTDTYTVHLLVHEQCWQFGVINRRNESHRPVTTTLQHGESTAFGLLKIISFLISFLKWCTVRISRLVWSQKGLGWLRILFGFLLSAFHSLFGVSVPLTK